MIKPEVLDAMIAAGCSAEQIVAAVKADAAAELLMRDTRRAAAALRQRRHRQSRTVTVTSRDTASPGVTDGDKKPRVSPTPPSETKNHPPSAPKGASSPAKVRGHRLAEDWRLPDTWRDWAIAQGVAAERADWEAEKFRDYWNDKTGASAAKKNWRGTWKNWIRKVIDDGRQARPGSNGAPSDSDVRRDMLEGLEKTRGMGTGIRPPGRRDP